MYVWCRQEIIKSKTDNRSYGKQWSSYFSVPNKIPERFLSTWPTFSMLTCNLPASDVSPEKQSGLLNYFLVNKTDFCEKSEEETKDVICFLVQLKTSSNFVDTDLENIENHGFQQGQIRGIKGFLHAEESRKTRRFYDGSCLCFGGPCKFFFLPKMCVACQ